VFTNLTHDHLDLHGTMDAYLRAKRTLFRGLKDGAAAVVNAEDPASDEILDGCRAKPWRYGEVPSADVRAIDADFTPRGTRLGLAWRGERAPLALPHPARHNVMNALAAACVGLIRGLSLQAVAARLADAPAVPGRLQFFSRVDGVLAVVDFAHSPDALRRALEAVRPAAGRLAVVFGCPGGSDRTKRPIMGEIAGRLADWTMLTSDNPKHEDPEAILAEISVGLRRAGAAWERIVDRGEAVRRAVRWARPGDVVLLAGKGHESFQIVGDAFLPYSDSCVLEASGFSEALPPVA